jgi:malonyl-CoA/methylmalonyl-CoA synthetase
MIRVMDPDDWIENAVRQAPHRLFLRAANGRDLTYQALSDESSRFAHALMTRGVSAGDRVAAQVDKSVEAVLLYVACLRLGAVFVPINVANTTNEVDYFLNDSQPRLVVVRPEDRRVLELSAARAGALHFETLGAAGEGSLPDLVGRSASAGQIPHAGGSTAPAAIIYTSGTTGRSKGAVLTRGNLASNAAVLASAWRFTRDDVLLHTLPLFHVHGLFAAINTVLSSGSSLVLMPKFDSAAVLERLPQVTVYMGVPTHYSRLLQESGLDRESTSGMRLFVSGSAPLLAETHQEFLQRTGHIILERYGMTETLMITSNPYEGERVPGSVGPALPGIAVRVTDADPATDAVGGIEVRGPNVFAGYWRDAQKTRAEFTADGWFKTGDLGRLDGRGYLYIVGRAKDLVISGGYNVYPREVESELDAVAGVLESAVFGVPHPDFGEGVTAAVVRDSGASVSAADLVAAIKGRLAAYKIPKRIVFLDELPRNALGKVQKNTLRSTYASLYTGGAL